MLNFATAIERQFKPRYSFAWYTTNLLMLAMAGAYIAAKLLRQDLNGRLETPAILALFMLAYSTAMTVKTIELGSKLKLHYMFWPAKVFNYKDILEVRLPELAFETGKPIKLENIANLEELQQEFKSLELMGVIPRGRIREFQPDLFKYKFRPQLSQAIGVAGLILVLVLEFIEHPKDTNIFWIAIAGFYVLSEIFNILFRKPKDE